VDAKVFFAAETLRIALEPEPPVLTVRLTGELDVACDDLVRSAAAVPADSIDVVVVDLSGLSFCDLAGVTALQELKSAHRSQGRHVQVVSARPLLKRILALVGDDLLGAADGCAEECQPRQLTRDDAVSAGSRDDAVHHPHWG